MTCCSGCVLFWWLDGESCGADLEESGGGEINFLCEKNEGTEVDEGFVMNLEGDGSQG